MWRSVARASQPELLIENLATLVDAVNRAKPQRCEGPVLQEPDGRLHHGPRHPRGCPGRAGEGSCLRAAGRLPRDPSVGDAGGHHHRTFRHRQRCVRRGSLGEHLPPTGVTRVTDRTEIVDRTRPPPGDADGHAEAGSTTGPPPGSCCDAATTGPCAGHAAGTAGSGARQERRHACQPRPSRPRSQSSSQHSLPAAPRSSPIIAASRSLTWARIRGELRGKGISYRVVKNRLGKIAAEQAGRSEFVPLLKGPSAVALGGNDEAALAKGVLDALRPYRNVVIRGGAIGGTDHRPGRGDASGHPPPA